MAAGNGVIITTADTVAGRATVEEIDIVAAECVFGMNMFRDLFASIREGYGGAPTDTVWKVTGERPRTFLQFARDHAAEFREGRETDRNH